ncbi:hypothetical protein LWE61_15945 [Sphingobium sufflavum]|uniref:hypothetical protein n=1 Tax=Sphingobium sufflavum TaxID=1129547 RepID=UPI001F38457A|nr:hypothetical protein [Sphingobium sufflavum]MCE7798041.1 hypothetical protein [Sphingobium sufflavum]
MTTRAGLSIRREAAISFGINALLSLAFFLALFGLTSRPLHWGAPGGLALDFIPQSLAVCLMSALVPCLIARGRLAAPPSVRTVLLRALAFAMGGGALGALLAGVATMAAPPPIGWTPALLLKLFYGGALGASVATLALRRMILR